jgi:hypothetical protein
LTDPANDTVAELRAALEAAIAQRDSLKRAGDAMVYEFSHPTRDGKRWMEAIVAYRRVSEEIDNL